MPLISMTGKKELYYKIQSVSKKYRRILFWIHSVAYGLKLKNDRKEE